MIRRSNTLLDKEDRVKLTVYLQMSVLLKRSWVGRQPVILFIFARIPGTGLRIIQTVMTKVTFKFKMEKRDCNFYSLLVLKDLIFIMNFKFLTCLNIDLNFYFCFLPAP